MRRAEVERAWHRACGRHRQFKLTRVSTHGKPPLGAFTSELPNGLVVVCGLNGVGKTTLLRLALEAFGGGQDSLRADLNAGGHFEIAVELGEADLNTPLGSDAVAVAYLDAAEDCNRLLEIARQPNFDDLTEGYEARSWTPTEVAMARFVVGKAYNGVRVTEFEAPMQGTPQDVSQDEDEEEASVLAFIEVDEGDLTYDFRSMGLGELAALNLLWRIGRLQARTVVLMEEPETYLAARASTALLSVLAKAVDEKQLYAIVTTHSPGVIQRAPVDSIRLLATTGSGTVMRRPASSAELEAMLDMPSGAARVVLAEDYTAIDFVRELIAHCAGAWVGVVEFLRTEGHEALIDICKKLPQSETIRLVGVLDGDQPEPSGCRWPVYRLPGAAGPDVQLRDAVLADVDAFAALTGRAVEFIRAAFDASAGEDAHDWFIEVARDLGLDVRQVRQYAVQRWLSDANNLELARDLVSAVTTALAASPNAVR